jgi:hypothetical protein
MKKLILILSMFISFSVNSQSFDGVPISGDLPTAIARYKAKGYTLDKYTSSGVILNGKILSNNIQLFIFVTPKSKKVYKMVAYLDEDFSWSSLKNNYNRFLNIFIDKYGNPDGSYESFTTPYFEGDGYELSAVGLDKVNYSAYWLNKYAMNLAIEISTFKQVKLTYENKELMSIKRTEQAQIEASAF